MTDQDILTAHGFSRGQIARVIAKHPHKRTPAEQAAVAALVAYERGQTA
jgi:hypothetical protein